LSSSVALKDFCHSLLRSGYTLRVDFEKKKKET